ncbi:MAG: SRPBCC family protein [Allobranchiibius sp.]
MRNLVMGTANLSATGTTSAAQAWERYAQPSLWSTWAPQIQGVETEAERLFDGATGTVHGPVGIRVNFVVTAFDDVKRQWSWTARFGPICLDLGHAVMSEGDGSRTTLKVSGPWPVVVAYLPVARFALHKLVN